MTRFSLILAAACLLGSRAAVCQASRVVPSSATRTDGNASSLLPFALQGGRVQQIMDGREFANASALLTGLAMKRDTQNTTSFPSRSYTKLILTLGHTRLGPSGMSLTFATNRDSQMKTVFSGSFNAPAQPPVTGAAPFNIAIKWTVPFLYLRSKGNLVWEIEIPGNTTRRTGYWVDGHIGPSNGAATPFGSRGPFASGDSYTVSGVGQTLVPGGKATLAASGLKSAYGSIAVFGFSRTSFGAIKLPFDLTPLGAPGNKLWASMDIIVVLVLRSQGTAFGGSVSLPIPNVNLAGIGVFGQAIFADRPSNPMGLVFSNGVEMRMGSKNASQARSVGAYDSSAATGFLTVRNSSSLLPGGIVVQLQGSLN
ncbi:MAG: hypothetical protein ACE5F1_08885 [Planctomycetota bacterium]